jgi:monoterpene epsilon-lactone hydrolase
MKGAHAMPSLQYYLMLPLMRLSYWQQARFPAQDVNAYVPFRERSDRMAARTMRPPADVTVEPARVSGVNGDWLIPPGAPDSPVMLFFHGGGILFTWGAPHRRMLGWLAKYSVLRAFGVDYRLMPGNPYPAAHDDCFNAYRALVEAGKRVVLIGESSGGVLALATLLRAKAAGLPQPPLCVLISPTVDYAFRDERIWQAKDPFIPARFVVEQHKHYIAGNDTHQPNLAPIEADLSGLAPLYVMFAEKDVIRCESERLADAARRWNVPMELTFAPHVWHGWHLLAPQLPEATSALKTIAAAIRQRVA